MAAVAAAAAVRLVVRPLHAAALLRHLPFQLLAPHCRQVHRRHQLLRVRVQRQQQLLQRHHGGSTWQFRTIEPSTARTQRKAQSKAKQNTPTLGTHQYNVCEIQRYKEGSYDVAAGGAASVTNAPCASLATRMAKRCVRDSSSVDSAV